MFGVHIVSTSWQHAQDVFCFTFDNLLHSAAVSHVRALEGNKLNMLTHIYSRKHMRKIKWPSAITRLTAHFTCGLRSDLVFAWKGKSMIIHDTECPCWDQVLLNITHSKLPCNCFYYTHPLICLFCCSVKDDVPHVVIASKMMYLLLW